MNNNLPREGDPPTILLVEDNQDHAQLVKRSFANHREDNNIYHVSDGAEALDYLFRREAYADAEKSPRPRLILLDLRLPKVNGIEVLKQIKASQTLRKIPVVALTSSNKETDVAKAFHVSANRRFPNVTNSSCARRRF